MEALQELVGATFRQPTVALCFNGNVSVTAAMLFGDLCVPEVPIASSVVMRGMAGLAEPPVQVGDIRVFEADTSGQLHVLDHNGRVLVDEVPRSSRAMQHLPSPVNAKAMRSQL